MTQLSRSVLKCNSGLSPEWPSINSYVGVLWSLVPFQRGEILFILPVLQLFIIVPVSAAGKILRRELRDLAKTEVSAKAKL